MSKIVITDNSIVTIEYTLKDEKGLIIDSSRDKEMLTFRMDENKVFNKIRTALLGKTKSDYLEIVLDPIDAFGEYSEEFIQTVPRINFGDIIDIKKDMQFQVTSGMNSTTIKVLDYDNSMITVDANHPLAGQKITFEIFIVDVN